MKRTVLLACCLLTACPGPKTGSPPSGVCRTSDAPTSCVRPPKPGTIPEIGSNQGVFLEGEGLERLHFDGHGVAFPPAPGTKLHAVPVCGQPLPLTLTVRGKCTPVPEIPGVQGIFTCQVDVESGGGICRSKIRDLISDPDPTHHRGVTVVRGFWDATGAWHDTPNTLTLSCDAKNNAPEHQQFEETDGAITKCARSFLLDPTTLEDAFLACIRMVRADYCGDGMPHTITGTNVGVATPQFPMTRSDCSDGRCFEASWSKDGAVCVAHSRWSGPGMGL